MTLTWRGYSLGVLPVPVGGKRFKLWGPWLWRKDSSPRIYLDCWWFTLYFWKD